MNYIGHIGRTHIFTFLKNLFYSFDMFSKQRNSLSTEGIHY
jgi:hypothetical protein